MKTAHILNIGYPKCGTSWLWLNLTKQSWFSNAMGKKENRAFIYRSTVEQYLDQYNKFDITANFLPNMFCVDRYVVKKLSECATIQPSIILRNPYDLYWSLFNYLIHDEPNYDAFVNNLINQHWFNHVDQIIPRWQEQFGDRFKMFFYEDLKTNPEKFIVDYCATMGLPCIECINTELENTTSYGAKSDSTLSPATIAQINKDIMQLQTKLDRDISHWIR